MLLCYVDESYTRDHYYLAALLCPDSEALPLTGDLDEVVARAAVGYDGIRPRAELHGYDIFQAKGDWEPLAKMPRARIGIYDDALRAIAAHRVHIIIEGVHPSSRLQSRHPHSVTLGHLLERIDEYASTVGERALVIADEPGQHDQQLEYRTDLRRYRSSGTGGWKCRKITNIVDTLHFAPSTASRLVQASDLIAFLYHRLETESDRDERAIRANQRLWSRLDPRCCWCHVWHPGDAQRPRAEGGA